MKKVLLAITFILLGVSSSFAQFEQGKYYIGAGVNEAGFSYDSTNKFCMGAEANVGYMFEQDWLGIADVGFKTTGSTISEITLGAKCRYLIEQNGLFLQLGAKFAHEKAKGADSYNDFLITPEVGYCFFISHYLAVEPSVYYDMSVSNFSDRSRFGLKIGLACYF